MDRSTRYPKEARERAARLVFEHWREVRELGPPTRSDASALLGSSHGQAEGVSTPRASARPRDGLQQQHDVTARAPTGDVHLVELDHLVQRDIARPSTRQSPLMPGVMSRGFCVQPRHCLALLDLQRAWTHEAHLALRGAEDLQQLVEAPAAQPVIRARHARIAVRLEHGAAVVVVVSEAPALLVGAHAQGAEPTPSIQKAISVATGTLGPETKTMAPCHRCCARRRGCGISTPRASRARPAPSAEGA